MRSFDVGSFKASPFLGQFGVVAGYQVSWATFTRSVDVAAETRIAEAEAAELERAAEQHRTP